MNDPSDNDPEQERMSEVAASLVDGETVDWTSALARAATEREVANLAGLEDLEQVVNFYRAWHREGASGEPPGGEPRSGTPRIDSGTPFGRFMLLERIGLAGAAELFRARGPGLGHEVALKRYFSRSAGDEEGLLRDARLLGLVRHRHVVTVFGADRIDGRVCVWMELVRGPSLVERLHEHGSFSAIDATAIGRDLCAALSAIHAVGLVHGSVTAMHVIREDGGRIVLMDPDTGVEDSSTGAARNLPTSKPPRYLAPEVLAGDSPTIQSDLYSLGALLFRLVTVEHPVTTESPTTLRAAPVHGARKRLRDLRPELSAGFCEAVERAIDPDPAQRPASAAEMSSLLAGS